MRRSTAMPAIAVTLGLGLALGCGSAPVSAAQPVAAGRAAQPAGHRPVRNGPILIESGPVIPTLMAVDPTTGTETELGSPGGIRSGCDSAVSPNGKLVAFIMACGYEAGKYTPEVDLVNSDGSDLRTILSVPGPPHYNGVMGDPSFSPDGTRLMVGTLVWTPGSSPTTVETIETIRLDGSDARTVDLGVSGSPDQVPQYSPVADLLAFSINGVLYLKAGDRPARLLASARRGLPVVGDEGTIHWSPNGRALVYSDKGSVYEVAVDGSGWRAVIAASATTDYTQPTFSPDGRELAVAALSTDPGDTDPTANTLDVLTLAHPGTPRVLVTLADSDDIASPTWLPAG
jgi:Tol biopolymer transport system component